MRLAFFAILFLFPGLLMADKVSVFELSQESGLPLKEVRLIDRKSPKVKKGSYFEYHMPELTFSPYGILVPTKDQSYYFKDPAPGFASTIEGGSVVADVASSLRDKIDQLKRQEKYRGPQIVALGILENRGPQGDLLDPELVLLVENVEGIRIPREPENRDSQTSEQFFGLFFNMVSDGYIPLDFHADNIILDANLGKPRPVDVTLIKGPELELMRTVQPRLFRLKMMQLAQSVAEIDRAATDGHSMGYQCRSILREVKGQFPEQNRWEESVRKAWEATHPVMAK